MDIFFTTLAAVIFYFIFSSISHRFFRKKKRKNLPPTPPSSLPILGHLHLLKQPIHRSLAALSAQYGPLLSLRLGSRPAVLVASPALAEDCLSKNDIIFANRPPLLAGELLAYNYSTVGFASYGPHWRNLRRLATVEILSSYRIQTLSPIRAEEVRSLLKSLFLDSRAGKSLTELKLRLSELTFNTMMGMIADKRYYGENVVDTQEAELFQRLLKEFELLAGGVSCLGDFLPVLRWVDFGGTVKRMRRLAPEMDEFHQVLIDKQRQKNKKTDEFVAGEGKEMKSKKKTLLEVMLALQETDPVYYTDDIIKGFISALLGAGTETSSLTVEWAMALLLNHPDVLEKAKVELDREVGDHLLEESDLANLPYLHCIINETLRLYPVAPLLLPHHSSEDTTVGGFTVPGDTMLLINAWAIHRDPEAWDEPDEFRPERFEKAEVGKEGCKFIPFGHGRRACPGEGLAMKMVALALGSLIQCFEWERVGEEKVDMSEGPGLSMPRVEPLAARYKPRETMLTLLSQL